MEDETALSIIDPITLNMDINKDHILEAQLQFLTVRLSYHDMCMFLQMLNSIPKQMFASKEQDHEDVIVKSNVCGFRSNCQINGAGFQKRRLCESVEVV